MVVTPVNVRKALFLLEMARVKTLMNVQLSRPCARTESVQIYPDLISANVNLDIYLQPMVKAVKASI